MRCEFIFNGYGVHNRILPLRTFSINAAYKCSN